MVRHVHHHRPQHHSPRPDTNIELEPLVEGEHPPYSRHQGGVAEKGAKRYALPHLGLFMAVLSSLFFSLCSLLVKILSDVSPMELAVSRFVGILLPTLPLLVRTVLMKKYRVQTRIINSSRVTQQTLIKKVYGVCVTDFGPWSTDLNSLSKHHFERPPAVA
ncbi:uncharacterized protein LOC121878531 isoform X2 [Homarus americanus]|uniref:uncharacterized protein LOC121878531 isoform X2 n=1 Tax=Homarus americanus TaxID=6706 RepID=UPI001C4665D5|nr:uncharacterized protein LOC121878531 isoform X2 [Homarus americanus]